MPTVGDVKKAPEIGFKGRALFVYTACPDCGREKWSPVRIGATRCWTCAARQREMLRNPVSFDGSRAPVIGDTARANAINIAGRGIYLYDNCPSCGVTRWVRNRNKGVLCLSCAAKERECFGEQSARWKGGFKDSRGYVYVTIESSNPFFCMVAQRDRKGRSGLIAEHRLVMAQFLGRALTKDEVVHHINGIKSDNRVSNLRVLSKHKHHSAMVQQDLQNRLRDVESRLTLMEAENVQLRKVLQEVRDSLHQHLNLQGYNTLGSCLLETIEGIVRATSNSGLNNESAWSPSSLSTPLSPTSSREPIPAALEDKIKWRCINTPNSGNAKSRNGYANPELAERVISRASVETIQGALPAERCS